MSLRNGPGYPVLCMGWDIQEEMGFMGFLSMAPEGCGLSYVLLGSEADGGSEHSAASLPTSTSRESRC